MKTAEEYFEEFFGDIGEAIVDNHHAIEFAKKFASQNTLNRDKVMEVLKGFDIYKHSAIKGHDAAYDSAIGKIADAICSLSLPTLS